MTWRYRALAVLHLNYIFIVVKKINFSSPYLKPNLFSPFQLYFVIFNSIKTNYYSVKNGTQYMHLISSSLGYFLYICILLQLICNLKKINVFLICI